MDRLISLNVAINAINERYGKFIVETTGSEIVDECKKILNQLPSMPQQITFAEVKDYCYRRNMVVISREFLYELFEKANWTKGNWLITSWDDYECSKCGDTQIEKHNFCPNCGADMRGEQHDGM